MPPAPTEEQEKPSTSMLKERRFKLSRACDRCRRRRIKCDEGHPCQACLSASSPCTFEEPGKRTHPHKSKRTATLEDRMHHLESLIQAIPPGIFAAGGAVSGMPSPHSSTDPSTNPLAAFASASHTYPSGVPPPSLHVFPLTNPSTHFTHDSKRGESPNSAFRSLLGQHFPKAQCMNATDQLAEDTARMTLPPSYMYFDDEGYPRWQGETSGMPLLDLLVERHTVPSENMDSAPPDSSWSNKNSGCATNPDWFPNRTPRRTDVNPETLWRLITSYIVPDLMDSLVQCYLSTSYYILPFLHVPSFLADYGNPQKWGEPGFAAFIVAICCLASRHMDDPRVRADPNDSISAGTQWFELLGRLRTLPIADRPTLYTVQADLVSAVYAVGLGKLSKAAALLSEAVTVCIDAGLHRSSDSYDLFDPVVDEVRKRTFWCVYIWDKQLSAHFGRPPMIRLRDCDVGEPTLVDDEFILREGIETPPPGTESRMSAFVCGLRMLVVLEGVVDVVVPSRHFNDAAPFLFRASSLLSGHGRRSDLREEEALLDEIHHAIPPYWSHTPETLASDDTIRVTQAERLHCAEQFVRMLIYRHRFSELVAERTYTGGEEEQTDFERDAVASAHSCALQIVAAYLHIASKGLMTYYGVHVIHQLTQAGRTLVAILLNCKSESLQQLMPPALDALRSCVGLLRRFSGRYVCGLRSGDLLEEFCRLTGIPLEPNPRSDSSTNGSTRPPWIRPAPKKPPSAPRSNASGDSISQRSSPEAFTPSEFFVDAPGGGGSPRHPSTSSNSVHTTSPVVQQQPAPSHQHYPLHTPSFIDNSSIGIPMDIMRPDPTLYMSPSEVMALFNENAVDVASLFPTDFIQQQSPLPQQGQEQGCGGFGSPTFQKLNGGLVTSP